MPARGRLYANTSELRAAVRKLMDDQNLRTARDVAARSQGAINFQTVDTILSFRVDSVRYSTLERLARALSANVNELLRTTDSSEPWLLPSVFDEVPRDVRRRVESALAEMLRASGVMK